MRVLLSPPAPSTGAALLAAADADADLLADRLHDGVLQALVAARYAADAAVRGGDPVAARDAVQTALVALRREVWLLRPRGADLAAALGLLSAQRVAAGGLPLDVHLSADLRSDAAAVAYRLVQAAAAVPGAVRVRLSPDGLLEVSGGEVARAPWSARARAVGGRLRPARAGSSALSLSLPVSDPEDDR